MTDESGRCLGRCCSLLDGDGWVEWRRSGLKSQFEDLEEIV